MAMSTDEMVSSVERAIANLNRDAHAARWCSMSLRGCDILFKATTAILAVASPALVAYSTGNNGGEGLQLGAIFLTGFAGAAATLQSVFGFQNACIRCGLDSLDLYELQGRIEQRLEDVKQFGDEERKRQELHSIYQEITRTRRDIALAKKRTRLIAELEHQASKS